MKQARSVDSYIASNDQWREALLLLRKILTSTSLEEAIKWGMPVYILNGKNVVGFSAFKSFIGIWFYQGVFLKDPQKKLINAQEGVTKALRQWRFTSIEEIQKEREIILEYLKEAIQNQHQGMEIKSERNKPVHIPPELQKALSENPSLKDSFHILSLSKRRDYSEYINTAKRIETRQSRLEKIIPMILEGIGLHDKYKQ